MIDRYTRPELGRIWSDEARMESWRRVEVAACEELADLLGPGEGPTEEELEAIRNATFTLEAVREREREIDHDMAAFVDVLAASAGAAGRWIHFGLTSSDVLDTALALQLHAAGLELADPQFRPLHVRENADRTAEFFLHGADHLDARGVVLVRAVGEIQAEHIGPGLEQLAHDFRG